MKKQIYREKDKGKTITLKLQQYKIVNDLEKPADLR